MNAVRFRRDAARRTRVAITFDFARMRIDELNKYCDQSERSMRKEVKEFHAHVKGQSILVDPNDIAAQHYVESLAEDFDEIENTFPQIHRRSLFIQSCADFEYFLMKVAWCFERTDAPSYFEFKKGKGITKSKEFLKAVGAIEFPADTQQWADIFQLFEVRNVIVHTSGTVVEDSRHEKLKEHKKAVDQFLRRWPKDVELDRFRQVTFSSDFVPQMLGLFDSFLRELRKRTM